MKVIQAVNNICVKILKDTESHIFNFQVSCHYVGN